MSRNTKARNNIYTIAFNSTITLSTINGFYGELKSLLKTPSTIVLDASAVKCVDTAALQLLCSWYSEVTNRGIKIQWKNIEGVLLDSAKLLGVAPYLALEA